ncbi:MAG TPA: hypothetical protein VIK77_05865 [Tissierellaceae bacterium]
MRFLNKHKYLRVIKFNSDKSSTITYYLSSKFKPNFLINPDHIFNYNGYRTVIITDKSAETINPLDFESKFNHEDFQTAIESKLIKDTFSTLKSNAIDKTTVMLLLSIILHIVVIYLLLKSQGAI